MSESTEINYDREKALESQVESVAYSYEEDPSPENADSLVRQLFFNGVYYTKDPKINNIITDMILHKEGRGCGFPSIYISPKKMSKRYFLDSVVLDAIKRDKTQLPKIIKEGFTPENGVDRDEAILLLSNVYQKTGDAFF